MPRYELPEYITPTDWKQQAEVGIRRNVHPGLSVDDRGALLPLALRMLDRPDIELVAKHLVAANKGQQFSRYDTDQNGGIDLPKILVMCVIWMKKQQPFEYDLAKLEVEYDKYPKKQKTIFLETLMIAKLLTMKKPRGRNRSQENKLIKKLNEHLRTRLGRKKSFVEVISILCGMKPDAVDKVLDRRWKERTSKYADISNLRREYKLIRVTGRDDGLKGQ